MGPSGIARGMLRRREADAGYAVGAHAAGSPTNSRRSRRWVKQGHRREASCGWRPRPTATTLNHNCVQVVGEERMRTEAAHRFAQRCAVTPPCSTSIPDAPADCGTSFYRQRLPSGQLGGNIVSRPHANLVEALGTRFVPQDSFVEDVRIAQQVQPPAGVLGQHDPQRHGLLGRSPAPKSAWPRCSSGWRSLSAAVLHGCARAAPALLQLDLAQPLLQVVLRGDRLGIAARDCPR